MFAVVITEKGGAQRRLDFDKTEVTIGRVQGNDIILPKGNVSKRHSRIVLKDNRFIVVDLKSTNGTYVNGRKITSPLVVKAGDKIYIGDFIVTLEEPAGAGAGASPSMGAPPPMGGGSPMGGPSPMSSPPMGMAPSPMSSPMGGPPPLGQSPMGQSPMGGGMGGQVMAAPLGGPPPLGQHGGHGPPPLAPSPMSSGPMGGPPPMPGADMGMGRPPARSAPPPPRTMGAPPMGAPAPPPLPRPEPAPSEPPPPMPAGADRFALDEEPADETMAPSPRVVLPSRPSQPQMQRVDGNPPPRQEPQRHEPQRAEPQRQEPPRQEPQRAEPQRQEPQRQEPQRAEPQRQEPQRAEPQRQEPVRNDSRQDMGRPDSRAEPSRAADLGHSHEFRTIELGPEGLGPLGPLLEEVGVLEIVVEGTTILVDRGNGLTATGQRFTTADSVARVARHLLSRARVVLDAKNPIGEAMLADGTHILAILPPVAVGGALVEVRRVGRPPPSGESLVGLGMLSSDMLQTLRAAIAVRRNVIVSGPSDAGVALLVGALAAMGAPEERLLIVEASTELAVANARAVRLTAGGTNFGDLLTRASRLRADRVVIDGVRGGEAREALVLAASRGGSTILGVRTTPAAGVLDHLEALASLSGGRDGVGALVQAAVHVVVRVVRGGDGVRRVDSVSELVNGSLNELFEHGENGFASTGQAASFLG